MIVTVLAAFAASVGVCTAGSEFEPPLCPAGLAMVSKVHILEQGVTLWESAEPAPPCKRFKLTVMQVKRFFRGASRVEHRAVHFTLPDPRCVAQGDVHFVGGSRGRWQIDQSALGWLDRPRQPRVTLYCQACRSAPWIR